MGYICEARREVLVEVEAACWEFEAAMPGPVEFWREGPRGVEARSLLKEVRGDGGMVLRSGAIVVLLVVELRVTLRARRGPPQWRISFREKPEGERKIGQLHHRLFLFLCLFLKGK